MPTFQLLPGEPIFFAGPMGSGKSNLIAWLLTGHSSVVIIDSKRHHDEWTDWGPRNGYVLSSDPGEIRTQPKVVYQVDTPVLMDSKNWNKPGTLGHQWTEALVNILKRGHTVVVFDEAVQQLPAGQPHPRAIQIMTQGGAWGISGWAGSQYANRVETMLIRGAVHAFCFKFNPEDLAMMGDRRGCNTAPLMGLPDYGFGYHKTNTPEWAQCQPVELVMRPRAALQTEKPA